MTDISAAQYQLDQADEYESQGKLFEALEACDLAIQLNPELAEAYNTRGIILEQLGDLDSAIADYEMAVQLQPSSVVAAQNLHEAQFEFSFLKRKRLLKTALLGGLGYGFSLMLVLVLDVVFNGRISEVTPEGFEVFRLRLGIFESIIVNAILTAIGIGMGTSILASTLGVTNRRVLIFYSFVGFGSLYLIISLLVEVINLFFSSPFFFNENLSLFVGIVKYALPGIVVGLLFARVHRKSRYILITALVGGSLGIMAFYFRFQADVALWVLQALQRADTFNYLKYDPQRDLAIIGAVAEGLRGLMGGSIFGAALGLVLTIPSLKDQIDADDYGDDSLWEEEE